MTSPTPVVIAINLDGTTVASGWGKAHTVAIATVTDGQITDWSEHAVGWDELHGQGSEGQHHARIVRFVREQGAKIVVTGHMGPPMHNTMTKLGCKILLGVDGDARSAALAAVAAPASPLPQGGAHHHHH